MSEMEKMKEVQKLSEEILKTLLKDGYVGDQNGLMKAVELLSRSISDLSFMYEKKDICHENLLKGTLAKVQISYNAIQSKQ
ncbi:hypothetical protein [Metabacillus sp. 84]|uniref:hypothetical protein n=1 Tax=unclassified Metabacillus TaxID=2675274 RepID=UPI003CEE5DDA